MKSRFGVGIDWPISYEELAHEAAVHRPEGRKRIRVATYYLCGSMVHEFSAIVPSVSQCRHNPMISMTVGRLGEFRLQTWP